MIKIKSTSLKSKLIKIVLKDFLRNKLYSEYNPEILIELDQKFKSCFAFTVVTEHIKINDKGISGNIVFIDGNDIDKSIEFCVTNK